jgi:hypothetical protein
MHTYVRHSELLTIRSGRGRKTEGIFHMRRSIVLLFVMSLLTVLVVAVPAGANGNDGPKKVWLCHFEDNNHEAPTVNGEYGYDRNGSLPGFWTVRGDSSLPDYGTHLTGDYIVKYNEGRWTGIPDGLNSGQIGLCEGNYGSFSLVSVNSLGSEEDDRGHRAQLTARNLSTYPDGWKG